MQKGVNKEFYDAERFHLRQIYENFSRSFREREGEYVRWLVLAAPGLIELARKRVAAEYEGKFILFPQYVVLNLLELNLRNLSPRLICY